MIFMYIFICLFNSFIDLLYIIFNSILIDHFNFPAQLAGTYRLGDFFSEQEVVAGRCLPFSRPSAYALGFPPRTVVVVFGTPIARQIFIEVICVLALWLILFGNGRRRTAPKNATVRVCSGTVPISSLLLCSCQSIWWLRRRMLWML